MGRILFLLFSVSVFFCVSCGESWSETAKEPMTWDEAVKYCDELVQKSYDDWHLPTIDELRRRIANCPATRPEGECSVSEENGNLPFGELEEACKGCPDDGENTAWGTAETKTQAGTGRLRHVRKTQSWRSA